MGDYQLEPLRPQFDRRLRLICRILAERDEANVADLGRAVGLTPPNVSRHLNYLKLRHII
jgi:DNA-binding transcriptional ArsR family regulator